MLLPIERTPRIAAAVSTPHERQQQFQRSQLTGCASCRLRRIDLYVEGWTPSSRHHSALGP